MKTPSEKDTMKQLKRLPFDEIERAYFQLNYFEWVRFIPTSGWSFKEFEDERFKRILARSDTT